MPQPSTENRHALIVAGESSGDLHGGNLIQASALIDPELRFFGVGGERMRDAGCRILFPSDELSVMGLVEVVFQLPQILQRFSQLKSILRGTEKPDLLVLVDFPDFNLRLAKVAKKAGVPVLYYISPKVWAWRSGRIKTIGERVDRLALIFPFEPELFASEPVEATYVGNPLLDEYKNQKPDGSLLPKLEIENHTPVVGIFPGSRKSELKYIFATLLKAAEKILQQKPGVRFLLPVAPSLDRAFFEQKITESRLQVEIVNENIYEVAQSCDAILSVSGTVTLQIALVKTPLVILYKAAPLTYAVGSRLVNVDHFGLVNIVAGKRVVLELVQDEADPDTLSSEILKILDDKEYAKRIKCDLHRVCELLGEPGCSRRVAVMASEMSRGVLHSPSYRKGQGNNG
ncbi:MAG TPA: lipid-A-disaccharide synthase [Geopsychrobacteraceae bacterium]|nr:lipid-A-disaccharide synthase [Geopsychrobacteraceae bacterium]